MIKRSIQLDLEHRVLFTRCAFDVENQTLVDVLGSDDRVARVMVVLDEGVADADPQLVDQIREYFASQDGVLELAGDVVISVGGEACKNHWERVPLTSPASCRRWKIVRAPELRSNRGRGRKVDAGTQQKRNGTE